MSTSDTRSSTESTGLEEATRAFEAILSPGKPERRQADEAPEAEAEADEAEALEADNSDETLDDDADTDEVDAEEDGAEEEADADAEDGEQLELPLDALVTVKVDGKEEQVPLKEAIAGYQRQADYSRKTADLAEARRQFGGEVEALRVERSQYAAILSALETQTQQGLATKTDEDWQDLKAHDPLEYALQREEWRAEQDRISAIAAERNRLQQLQSQEQAFQLQQHVENQRNMLAEALPVARDPKAWDAARKSLRDYGKTLGYSDEELSQAYDHRAVTALWKAMQYDRMVNKKPIERRPETLTARRPKTVAAGNAASTPARVTEVSRAKQRLARTGRVSDAAKVFETLL